MGWFVFGLLLGFAGGFVVCYWIFVSRKIAHIKRDLEAKARALRGEASAELKKVADKL